MPLILATQDEPVSLSRGPPIEIGVLNNLSDAGLESGDRQITDLLRDACGSQLVRLHFFSLPSIARGAAGEAHIAKHYTDFAQLWTTRLDGLFITGCEPRMARLPEEAFWPLLTQVIDWAEHNTRSTVFSCLAAHAAVLHLDGIERRRLKEKCTGLFSVERATAHPLLDGMPLALRVPHSRHNGLDAADLVAAGYRILTRGDGVEVDVFVKSWRSLFVYLQGHPEYDPDALRREYRRDVLRYLEGTSDAYPNLPAGYFDRAMEARLATFSEKAKRDRDPVLIAALPIDRKPSPAAAAGSRDFAVALFRNWLDYLLAKTSNHAA